MLKAILYLQKPLDWVSKNTTNSDYKKVALNATNWLIVKNLTSILKIFVKPSIRLQGQLYTTLPMALLDIYLISNKL